MKFVKHCIFVILFGLSLFSGFACENEGPMEEAGEEMGETMEETEEEMEEE